MKRLRWSALKRHIALPLAIVAAVLIIAALVQVRGVEDQGTYEIAHLYGDPSVMKGINISGAIQDANHRTSFMWRHDQNHVDTKTEVFAHQQKDRVYRYFRGMFHPINDYYYYVNEFKDLGFFVDRGTIIDGNWKGLDSINLDITVKPLVKKDNNVVRLYVDRNNGLTETKGDIYFTLASTSEYKGINGIYKLNFDQREEETAPIMTFSLDNTTEEDGARTAVLGLESVNDALALLLVKDDKLVIEGYRTDGAKLGEVVVAPFLFQHINAELADDASLARYEVTYEAYSQEETGVLSLSFNSNQSHRTIVTLQRSEEGLQLVDITEIDKEDELLRERSYNEFGERFITYRDGRLYYVGVFHEFLDKEGNALDPMSPIRILLHVYEQGNIVYTGELITDINDDLLRVSPYDLSNYNYDRAEYRNVYDLYIH